MPDAEKPSWGAKAAAAAVPAGRATAADLELIGTEAALLGVEVAELARRVLRKAAAFRVVAANLAACRQRGLAAFAAAGTPAEVRAALAAEQRACRASLTPPAAPQEDAP